MNRLNLPIKFIVFGAFLIVYLLLTINVFAEEDHRKKNAYNKLKVFSEIISLIESNYVETVKSDTMIEGAIRGMVKSLDPHTTCIKKCRLKQPENLVG